MREPKGSLTAAQYEIMDTVWNAGYEGVSVANIWQAISQARAIGRTNVLNQVDRLEKTRLAEVAAGRRADAVSGHDRPGRRIAAARLRLRGGFLSGSDRRARLGASQ
jgi:hypothetical protein